jgi:hypothetical protein
MFFQRRFMRLPACHAGRRQAAFGPIQAAGAMARIRLGCELRECRQATQ